ncbi:uncharacterized protein VTP21DRAFT_3855 [Calcarisporiella thermophila]|uniref:uncharacterized protein n=1 Tax=Calcarisporiella thermophila TaxID=911321 RepID=UPI003742D6A9
MKILLICLATLSAVLAKEHEVITGGPSHFAFIPQNLTIRAGDTVKWVWQDPIPHSVVESAGGSPDQICVAKQGGFNSQKITGSGKSYSQTFNNVGVVYYNCDVPGHCELGMWGKISVVCAQCPI